MDFRSGQLDEQILSKLISNIQNRSSIALTDEKPFFMDMYFTPSWSKFL